MAERYELDAGEQIVRRINRSIMDLLPVLVAAATIVFITIASLVGYIVFRSQLSFLPVSFMLLVAIILLLIAASVGLTGYYVWSHNYMLLTNIHIIKIEQVGLFNEKTAQLEIARMQDITGARHGVAQTLFDYGDVEIETAGAQENFIFRNASAPQMLADHLMKLHNEYMAAHPGAETRPAAPADQTTSPQPAPPQPAPVQPAPMDQAVMPVAPSAPPEFTQAQAEPPEEV